MSFETRDTPDRLTRSVGAMALLHASNQAVIEATIERSDAAWYDLLDQQLGAAENLVVGWRRSGFLHFQQEALGQVVACGQTFLTVQAEIDRAFDDLTGAGAPRSTDRIADLLAGIQPAVTGLLSGFDRYLGRLADFQRDMTVPHHEMKRIVAQVQEKEAALRARIDAANRTIGAARDQIVADRKAIADARHHKTAGIVETIFGFVLAPLSGGASLILAGIGVGTIAEAEEEVAHLQSELVRAQLDIVAEQAELSDDQRQVVTLQGVLLSVGMVLQDLVHVSEALGTLRVDWSVLDGELKQAIADVRNAADASQALVARAWFDAACETWRAAIDVAQRYATADVPAPRRIRIGG